jgi:hypothetical protein
MDTTWDVRQEITRKILTRGKQLYDNKQIANKPIFDIISNDYESFPEIHKIIGTITYAIIIPFNHNKYSTTACTTILKL